MRKPGRYTTSRFKGGAGGGEALPRLQGVISPEPPVANQQVTVTFDAEPQAMTAIQDGESLVVSGTGLTRTFTPLYVGNVEIDARRDGYRRFYATREVVEAAPVPAAPVVTATASIGAAGTVLDGPLDAVTGYPNPEPAFEWFNGGSPTVLATTKSYDHGGTDGAYRRETIWTNGVGDPARSVSNTITIAPAPSIQVDSLTPNPLVAGQLTTITFNVLPGSVSVTQGQTVLPAPRMGTTNNYTFTPVTTEPVSIAATKAGYTPYNATLTVQQAPAALAVDPAYNVFRVDNLTGTNKGITFTAPAAYAETEQFNTSTAANGPALLDTVALEVVGGGTADPGKVLRLDMRKIATKSPSTFKVDALEFRTDYVNESTLGTLLTSTGREYTVLEADRGKTIRPRVVLSDVNGPTLWVGDGVAVPSTLQPDAPTSAIANVNGMTFQSGQPYTQVGGAGVLRTIASSGEGGFWFAPNSTAIVRIGVADRGDSQFMKATWKKGGTAGGVYMVLRLSADGSERYELVYNGSTGVQMRVRKGGINTVLQTLGVPGMSDPIQTLEFELTRNGSDDVLRAYRNGTQWGTDQTVPSAQLLTGGATGIIGLGTNIADIITNIEARATR